MIKIILEAVFHIAQILTGFAITIHGLINNDWTQFGVGLIVMSLPTIDRIDDKLRSNT
jgi:hypothetical protein